ncbi:MAG: hydrogenase [Spirochaetes bacterium]|nr:MAG: hydrogenase [Spirochaetota bacterium]
MSKKRIAVVGVGNILMGDEGFGVRVIQYLKEKSIPNNVSLIDAGTWFFNIAGSLTDFDRVIVVDIAKGGKDPGTIYRFYEKDIKSNSEESISLHDFGVIESLNLERLVRKMPDDIIFYGIEPERIELSMDLSDKLKPLVQKVAEEIIKEVKN